jgi:DNA-binding CsgD family transcriptional regulator
MVIMFYVSQGFDTAQIASEMGITYQTVKGELYRVRNKLGHDGAYIQLMLRIRQAIA